MTTIVYDHENKQIACDSRACNGNIIKSNTSNKWRFCGANLYFLSGSICDFDDFIRISEGGSVQDDTLLNCIAFIFKNGKVYKSAWCRDDGYWEQEQTNTDAIGTGEQFALSALDFGKTAKEAVEYAMTRDCYTGGKVHVYDIETARFI